MPLELLLEWATFFYENLRGETGLESWKDATSQAKLCRDGCCQFDVLSFATPSPKIYDDQQRDRQKQIREIDFGLTQIPVEVFAWDVPSLRKQLSPRWCWSFEEN